MKLHNNVMDLAFKSMILAESMKENGLKINEVGMDLSFIRMGTLTKATIFATNLMEKEPIIGRMEKCSKENGSRDASMVSVYGSVRTARHIWVSGKTIKSMVMACIFGRTATNMKENGRIRLSLGRAQICLQIRIYTQGCMSMDFQMDMASTNGNQKLHSPDSSWMDISKEKENGRRTMHRSIVTNTAVNTIKIRSMVKGSLTGKVEITISELILTI